MGVQCESLSTHGVEKKKKVLSNALKNSCIFMTYRKETKADISAFMKSLSGKNIDEFFKIVF